MCRRRADQQRGAFLQIQQIRSMSPASRTPLRHSVPLRLAQAWCILQAAAPCIREWPDHIRCEARVSLQDERGGSCHDWRRH